MSSKLCECGCGQYTKLASKTNTERGWKKGEPLRFINGHNNAHENKPNSKIQKYCKECGKPFKVFPCQAAINHCSTRCAADSRLGLYKAPIGHTRKTSGGYLQIKVEDHPYADKDGYVMYHRWVLEQYYKMYISREFDVHHIDEDIENNDLSNLAILTRSEHMSLHAKKNNKKRMEGITRDAFGRFNSRRMSQVTE